MNKELEALEELRSFCGDVYYREIYDKDYQIIESALKDYEKLKDEYDRLESIYNHFIKQYNQLMKDHSKAIKALEIIKRLINKSGIENWIYETENDYVFADFRISKEEYDLLKEVLL